MSRAAMSVAGAVASFVVAGDFLPDDRGVGSVWSARFRARRGGFPLLAPATEEWRPESILSAGRVGRVDARREARQRRKDVRVSVSAAIYRVLGCAGPGQPKPHVVEHLRQMKI